jgi:transcriptional regulator with XRE-family HTH domain
MPPENQQFIEILESEFARVRNDSGSADDKYRTIKEMAEFLDIDPTLLSRYRLGVRTISHRFAYQFAEHLRSDADEQKKLVERLLSAKPTHSDDEIQVQKWFQERGRNGFLLLVQFFEPPVLGKTNPLLENVARAVAGGLCYGIMFPFSLSDTTNKDLPLPLQEYLRKVWLGVQDLYSELLSWTLEEVARIREEGASNSKDRDLKKALRSAADRLKVFKIKDANETTGSGKMPEIGYRRFYCRDHRASSESKRELWQWNTTPDGAKMLQRKAEDFELEAVEALLYPVPQEFQEQEEATRSHELRLPTDQQLLEFQRADRRRIKLRLAPEQVRWEVAEIEGCDVEQVIEAISRSQTAPRAGGSK